MTAEKPLVSFVTPAYNGGKYISECIESVLAQTYETWEYIILNNCSTDDTLDIANNSARLDPRIRVHSNERVLPIMENWNASMRLISPQSIYTKVVHADDKLLPQCAELMVYVAERNPEVGIVGSYSILGNSKRSEVQHTGIPYPVEVVSGHEINRATFLGDYHVFGPPTVPMFRSNLVRQTDKFFDQDILYGDTEVCFRLLVDCDFGFVHQVLSFVRLHEESVSSTVGNPYNREPLEFLGMLEKYGPLVFSRPEYEKVSKKRFNDYYRFLGKNILFGRERGFWDYNRNGFKKIGHSLSYPKVVLGSLKELIFMIFNPVDTYERYSNRRKRLDSNF